MVFVDHSSTDRISHRTLIVGLDGATFGLIRPWAAVGVLPTIGRLMCEGAWGVLDAYPNMGSASGWSSIVTGCNPGKHGVLDFGRITMREDELWHSVTGRDRQREPFWRLLSAAGQRVNVLNVPISYPADTINGCMLSGMDAPSTDSPGFAHPAGLAAEIRQAGIAYVLDVPNLSPPRRGLGASYPHQEGLPSPVRQMVEARTQAALHVMRMAPWDVTMVVYIATDPIQHFYWGEGPPSSVSPTWRPVRELYELLDDQLNQLIKQAGKEATIIVLSDHGFGPSQPWRVPMDVLLARLGWLQHRTRAVSYRTRLQRRLLRTGRGVLPPALQRRLSTAFPREHAAAVAAHDFADIDWARTKVFPLRTGGRLVVNLRGRQAQGCVAPEDYDSVCEGVRASLLTVTDPATGRPAVRVVHRREELYRGPFVGRAADLTVGWDYEVLRGEIQCAVPGEGKAATIENQRPLEQWRGSHRREGIFIACGPEVRAGAALPPVTQYDIAPTVYYLQGQPVPSDVDGRVLTELFDPELLQRHPIKRVASTSVTEPQEAPGPAERVGGHIEERLRGLGYF